MAIFLQFITGGLFFGGMYTLIALGIVTIYKSTRVFNLAQGWMVTLGAFMLVSLVELLRRGRGGDRRSGLWSALGARHR